MKFIPGKPLFLAPSANRIVQARNRIAFFPRASATDESKRPVACNCRSLAFGRIDPAMPKLHSFPMNNLHKEIKMNCLRRTVLMVSFATAAACSLGGLSGRADAATADDLNHSAVQTLESLYRTHPIASDIAKSAKAVLVFPNIVKAGLVFGGSYGEGVLMKSSTVVDYYNSVSGSWGLQAGAESYGYAVFLMTDEAVRYLNKSHGWEIGVGPTVVVVNEGVAKNLSTSTLKDSAYAFIFDQQGLMASLSIEGTKISRIKR